MTWQSILASEQHRISATRAAEDEDIVPSHPGVVTLLLCLEELWGRRRRYSGAGWRINGQSTAAVNHVVACSPAMLPYSLVCVAVLASRRINARRWIMTDVLTSCATLLTASRLLTDGKLPTRAMYCLAGTGTEPWLDQARTHAQGAMLYGMIGSLTISR